MMFNREEKMVTAGMINLAHLKVVGLKTYHPLQRCMFYLQSSSLKKAYRLKVSWTKERVGIGDNELEELDWGKMFNLCVS